MITKRLAIIIVSMAIIFFALPTSAQTNTQCRWIYSAANDTEACQRTFKTDTKKWQATAQCDASSKGTYDNTCCCPVQSSKKYIIIGSLIAVFGIITVISFALHKTETS